MPLLFLLVYPNPLFHAHWAFLVPYSSTCEGQALDTGFRAEAEGSPIAGFKIVTSTDYSFAKDDGRPHLIKIGRLVGHIEMSLQQDSKDESAENTKISPVFRKLEGWMHEVEAPAKSLGGASGKRVEIRDCQWWAKRVVEKLVADGRLVADDLEGGDPLAIINSAPEH